MNRKFVIGATSVALLGLLVAAGAHRQGRRQRAAESSSSAALGLVGVGARLPGSFAARVAGEHASYALKYDANIEKAHAPMIAMGLAGSLELWTVNADAKGSLLRAKFAGHTFAEIPDADASGATAALEGGFAEPTYIALDPKGQVLELRFRPGLSRLAQTTWRSLAIAALQFIHGDAGATVWQSNEADENGNSVTEYDAAAAGGYDKRKLRYVSEYLPELKHRVIESSQHFDFDKASLPLRVSERESLGVTTGNLGLAEMASSVTLDLKRTALEPVIPDPGWLTEAAQFERLDLKESGTPRARQSALDEAMASRLTFDEAMLALFPGPDGKPQKSAGDAYHALIGQLRLSDSALPRLLDHIKKHGPLRAKLISTLRDAGTASTQKALRDLFDDPDATADDRASLIRDLSLVETPTAETVQMLTSMMHDPVLGAQAELGMGATAYELRESSPGLAAQTVATLVQDLQQAPDDAQRRRALGALGNSGGDAALPAVKPFLDSGSEATQISATESLRRMPGAQIDLLLANQLRHSAIPAVRTAAAGAIRYRDLTPPLVSALAEALRLDPDASVRRAVVDVAAFFLQQSSILRDALAYVSANDVDPKLRTAAQQALD